MVQKPNYKLLNKINTYYEFHPNFFIDRKSRLAC